jgi:signal transduction histidine kinase/streptogramin lyase
VPAGLSRNPMVISLAEDREGWIWVGTDSDGLRSVDPRSGSYHAYRHVESDPSSLSHNRVHRIFVDHLGTVWIGTDDGLDRFDRKTGAFRTYKVQEWSRRSQNYVAIAEDSSGRLWLGTAQTGLHRFDPNTGEFRIYRSDPRQPQSLRDDTVPNVYIDKADIVWVATQTGLNRLDPKTDRFEAFDTRNGLPGNSISCIREDARGNLWISTNNGISRFDPKARTFENYSESDGLPGNDLTGWDTCATSKEGELFFGGFEGAVGFYPEKLTQTRPPTPVVLTELDIGGVREVVGADRILKQGIAYSRSITLTHSQTEFSLAFAGLQYDNPASTRYRYRLLGFNSNWNEVDSRNRRATYTSLPAGTYSFQVQASSQVGQWSEPGESLNIRILPPWWSTWWFRTMYIAAVLFVLWGTYRWRITAVSRLMTTRMEERIRERTRIAQDLHDTLLQGLLSASMQLGVAKNKLDDHPGARALVERVFSMIGQMIQESRNVVSGLRTRSAHCQELESAISKIPTEIPLSSNAEFRVLVEGTPKLMREAAREELYWIARESIANAFRHSRATLIEVLLEYGVQQFRLVVRDNGIGMESPSVGTRDGHWGLSGMAERARRIGGKIRIASRKGAGTEVDVQVQKKAAYEGKRLSAAALTEDADV